MLMMMFRAGVNVHNRFYINPGRPEVPQAGYLRVQPLKAAIMSIGGLSSPVEGFLPSLKVLKEYPDDEKPGWIKC